VSLRARLILAATYVLTVVVLALEIPLAITIERNANRDIESTILSHAALVAARINDDVPNAGTDPATPPKPPPAIADIVASTADSTETRIIVTDRFGRVLVDSDGMAVVGTQYATAGRPEFRSVFSVEGGTIDVRRRPSADLGEDLLLVTVPVVHNREVVGAVRISEELGELRGRIHRSWLGLGLIGLAAILAGLLLAWLMAVALARPMRRLSDAATRLGRGDLASRAPVEGPREVATLARSFNHMAQTLSANVGAQRDFLANASHQLRTPLTGLQLRLEAIEQEGGFAGEQAAKAQTEVTRLNELVEDLLELARASSVDASGEQVDLGEVARAAVDRWTGPAAKTGKRIMEQISTPVPVWANADDLAHVLDNLLENSIRYSTEGAEITVQAKSDGQQLLVVSDTGPGIPPADRDRIFERFYRGTTGRKAGPGTGLGLAVVAELVQRWGGEVRVADRPGMCIEAAFPRPPTDP
jgi:signal transduction histidine kinase